MKILITGASGFIGSLTRYVYREHSVTLLSRSPIDPELNEMHIRSGDLKDESWWSNCLGNEYFDVIFHFAEPVKEALSNDDFIRIVRTHSNFLRKASQHASLVVYPLSAYRYDLHLSKNAGSYLGIKDAVFTSTRGCGNIAFPVFHPIIDGGNGIHRITQAARRIPLIDLFCEFKAQLPVLYLSDLSAYLQRVGSTQPGVHDIYSKYAEISELFSNSKAKIKFLSSSFHRILALVDRIHLVNLLVRGRRLR